ncbi:MAG: DUF3520 domain-containing protein [Proteobacteria bacterium]|nr:DUF3520 domain-containing protein [Pseudomonadota bacterium]MCP4921962.1 DUF3520 domain-containing protein [Pseudomonadota bacterium]
MSSNSPRASRDRRQFAVLPLGIGLTIGALGLVALFMKPSTAPEPGVTIEEIPDRFTQVLIQDPSEPAARPEMNPDAGEGAKARQVEGKVGKKDAKMQTASGDKTQLNKEIAESAGLLGVHGGSGMSSEMTEGIGSLSGAKGVQTGSGGLGSRGSGLGGGGTAEGLGGLGTKGRGSSSSGYGSGGGSFGAKGEGGIGRVGGSANRGVASSSYKGTTHPSIVLTPDTVSSRENYTDYGVNQMTIAENDRVSTFAADVDTASYAISRSKLRAGQLPPTDAVRVEEFVNAMDYDYRSSKKVDGAPFSVYMEAAPNPFASNHHVLRVGLKGAEPASERTPWNLTFLVDVSGSMSSPQKLGLAKESLIHLTENMGPEDTVSLVTYAGNTRVVLDRTSDKAAIIAGIADLNSGGGTAMGSGMELAYQSARAGYVHGSENRVIVMSDGDANIGRTHHSEILETVRDYAEEGITLTTVGFGNGNYQDTMMERLANEGDGNYFYIDSIAEGREVFGEDLASTINTIARDVKLQVEFNPDVVYAYRLIGYENRDIADKDFRNDSVDAGEVGRGHEVTALYDVVLMDSVPAGELATVRIRAKKPGPDVPAKEWMTVFDNNRMRGELADTSDGFRLAFGAASFAELLRDSPYASELSYAEVYEIVQSAQRSGNAEDVELLSLISTAGSLAGDPVSVANR